MSRPQNSGLKPQSWRWKVIKNGKGHRRAKEMMFRFHKQGTNGVWWRIQRPWAADIQSDEPSPFDYWFQYVSICKPFLLIKFQLVYLSMVRSQILFCVAQISHMCAAETPMFIQQTPSVVSWFPASPCFWCLNPYVWCLTPHFSWVNNAKSQCLLLNSLVLMVH